MDRNRLGFRYYRDDVPESLSARRAWIEIALAPEQNATQQSLSARRAWIEMTLTVRNVPIESVALRKESVDRNTSEVSERVPLAEGRSPQGERG